MDIQKKFSKIKVLIVGDVMIDRNWWGSVERISPEAPVPVVRLDKTTLALGGAANVAANVAGLGAKPILIGAVGDDEEANLFTALLKNAHIYLHHLVKIKKRPTTIKTRIIAHNQQVTRIDQETNLDLTNQEEKELWKEIEKYIFEVDAIILSDYAKGVLTANLLKRLITKAKQKNITLLVDPKGKNFNKYKGASIITPNQREISEAKNLENPDRASLENLGREVISHLDLAALLITQGEKGMLLLEKNQKTVFQKAFAREVYDVTGAGDTVIATMAVSLGAKFSYAKSAELANIAAGLVVEQIGTTAIKIEDLFEVSKNF